MKNRWWFAAAVMGLLMIYPGAALADQPRIAIIIDDMGQERALGERALSLPGPVSYAFLPGGPHTRQLAERAHDRHRDVLLHQPMQPVDRSDHTEAGIGLDSTRSDVRRRLGRNLAAVPHAKGVNNHQGSLVTRHPGHMDWLMETLADRGDLFFIDSRTTARTVAEQMARETGIPVAERDVFLDHDRATTAITRQFQRLVAEARRHGQAIAIGHPDPRTLTVLEKQLARLHDRDVKLVPVSELVTQDSEEGDESWHVSSSR